MSMNIALSGLGAAQKDLNTTSNNIANANTFGFKESRAEFGDVYSNSIFSNAKTTTGGGVQTSTVAQQFHEGSSIYTNNPLDLRITGNGFFRVTDDKTSQQELLTRNGAFHLNKENELVNSEGKFLLGYNNTSGSTEAPSMGGDVKPLKIEGEFGKPQQSDELKVSINLSNKETQPKKSPFDFNDSDSYNHSTSSTIYDSLGKPYQMATYYVAKNDPSSTPPTGANSWEVFQTVTNSNGTEKLLKPDASLSSANQVVDAAGNVTGYKLKFDSNGQSTTQPLDIKMETFASASIDLGGANPAQSLTMKYENLTQYASAFEVRKFEDVNGASTGYLTKIDINPEGQIVASYSNGKNPIVGQIALGRVRNEQGLAQAGGTLWHLTQESGDLIPQVSTADGTFGAIKSGTLEQSNIDMTQELVDLISAQRNFQASSRALDVNNQLQQNILQIR